MRIYCIAYQLFSIVMYFTVDCVYQDKHVDEQETVTPNNLSGRIGVHKFNCEGV